MSSPQLVEKEKVAKQIDQNASLFVGRWQPFHKGHKALIETVLKKRKARCSCY
jgi:FAD synthase